MAINALPYEILARILSLSVTANKQDGIHFTYGLSKTLHHASRTNIEGPNKYVKGPLRDDTMAVDAAYAIRRVCHLWGAWTMSHNFVAIREQCYSNDERWADLTSCRSSYPVYELIDSPGGTVVKHDRYSSLRKTHALIRDHPLVSQHVRRLWFNGFHTSTTDNWIISIIRDCPNLTILAVPWSTLQSASVENWQDILKTTKTTGAGRPLVSLEILCGSIGAGISAKTSSTPVNEAICIPQDVGVNFELLQRLRLSGEAGTTTVIDNDLVEIAKTATNLESIQITGSLSVSINGLCALIKSSQRSVRLLEYRNSATATNMSHFHEDKSHRCVTLSALSKLRELHISVPSICEELFNNHDVKWSGTCSIRFQKICEDATCNGQEQRTVLLKRLLGAARSLVDERRRLRQGLILELTYGNYVFRPGQEVVHGEFLPVLGTFIGDEMQNSPMELPLPRGKMLRGQESTPVEVSESWFLRAMAEGWIYA